MNRLLIGIGGGEDSVGFSVGDVIHGVVGTEELYRRREGGVKPPQGKG